MTDPTNATELLTGDPAVSLALSQTRDALRHMSERREELARALEGALHAACRAALGSDAALAAIALTSRTTEYNDTGPDPGLHAACALTRAGQIVYDHPALDRLQQLLYALADAGYETAADFGTMELIVAIRDKQTGAVTVERHDGWGDDGFGVEPADELLERVAQCS